MKIKRLIILILVLSLLLVGGSWIAGSLLIAPKHQYVGDPPAGLAASKIQFQSKSGANIHGWFIPGKKGLGAIVLMHGVRANRLSMLDRARFLSAAGFAVLLFDFQAHGESSGEHITFGYLESRDAQAAVEFLRTQAQGERIGVIGVSMGGAAIVGAEDQHTTLGESKTIFTAAAEPKELWIVAGVKHTDLHAEGKAEYELRVLGFFGNRLVVR